MPTFERQKKDYSSLSKEKIRKIQNMVFLVSKGTSLESKNSFFNLLLCEPDGTKDQNKLLIMKFNLELNTYLHHLLEEKAHRGGSGLKSAYLYHRDLLAHTVSLHHESNHKEALAAFSIDVYYVGEELGTHVNGKAIFLPLAMGKGCGLKDGVSSDFGLETTGVYSLNDHADYLLRLASIAAESKGSK
jgi:hypothetical protein